MSSLMLAIDASTYVGTVALVEGATILAVGEAGMRGAEEERLMPAVDAVFAAAGVQPRELAGIVCGGGPGSFTPLRIAASIAKGIASARGVPLFAVPSLALIAAESRAGARRVVAALDAMRGEFYVAAAELDDTGQVVALGPVRREPSGALEQVAIELGGLLTGPESVPPTRPHARGVVRARALIQRVDLDGWEPFYGRLAEAQVRWEEAQGRRLDAAVGP
jgi:tRNA threonylcarbamoyladenosine biosynthesis protein TsaB